MSVSAIREALAAAIGDCESVTLSSAVLPIDIPRTAFPAVTVFLDGVTEDNVSTSGVTRDRWRFRVDMYVTADSLDVVKVETVLCEVLAAVRADKSLAGTCFFATVEDGGNIQAVESASGRYLLKTLYVVAETEESP